MTSKTEYIDDPYHLTRFLDAQEDIYEQALYELKCGQKKTHWMWFIFPQVDGLGRSPTAIRYAIKSRQEAEAYLAHPVLRMRLDECAQTILDLDGYSAFQIFDVPDDGKLRSSMTLFASVCSNNSIYHQVLNKYFDGYLDENTLKLLEENYG